MTASTGRVPGSLSVRWIVDVPFAMCAVALDRWNRAGDGDDLRSGNSQPLGPMEHDHDSGTRRIGVRMARGPLRPLLRLRLDIDRWSSSSTVLELIPCGRVQPTAAYVRAGHLLLDSLSRTLPLPVAPPAPGTRRAGRTCPPVRGVIEPAARCDRGTR